MRFASLAWSAVFALGECMCPVQYSESWRYEWAVERLTWKEDVGTLPDAFSWRSGWPQLEKGPDSNCLQILRLPSAALLDRVLREKTHPASKIAECTLLQSSRPGTRGTTQCTSWTATRASPTWTKVWRKFYEDSRTSLDVLCKSRECNTFWT